MPKQIGLSLVLGAYPHVAGLVDGSTPIEGFTIEPVAVPSLQQAFKHMCREVCYDVCEMSITGYLLARRYGLPFTALPVFPVRGFPQSHTALVVNRNSQVSTPKDIEGKRVGARAYTGTASLWVRGILQDEYGVDLGRITWVSAEEEHVPQYIKDSPHNVSYEVGSDIASMLVQGDLAAAIGIRTSDGSKLTHLITDARSAATNFYWRSGIYQINHTVVVRDQLLRQYPNLAKNLYCAFLDAKRRWLATDPPRPVADELGLPGGDPFPYGLEENADSLNALLRYAMAQGLMAHLLSAEEAFPLRL